MWENNCSGNNNSSEDISPVGHSANTHGGCVKALHMRRDALKARIRQKHERQRQAERESCIARARDSGTMTNNFEHYDNNYRSSNSSSYSNSGNGSIGNCNNSDINNVSCNNSNRNSYGVELNNGENTLARFSLGVEDVKVPDTRLDFSKWADVGREFGCDVSEYEVMQYLLELEDEIRQEQLINMYEESNNTTDWDEYYRSLTS